MPNYQLGKIYKIVDNTNGNIYVGSTCEPTLARRLSKHVGDYKCYLNGKHNFVTSYEILKNDNYDIVLLENCQCENKDELYIRERHYIETLNCVNKIIVGRTDKEYRNYYKDKIQKYWDDNKETLSEKAREYRRQNKETLSEKKKIKYLCECGSTIRKSDKKQHNNTIKHQNYITIKNNNINEIKFS